MKMIRNLITSGIETNLGGTQVKSQIYADFTNTSTKLRDEEGLFNSLLP
jgi:hypothetical protein